MKIKIEDVNGTKKYWVNDVAYDRIEDMPAQYREYFKDANNNGIPDQFDDLMNTVNKMQGGAGAVGGLFDAVKSQSKKNSEALKGANYTSGEERSSIAPTLLKIGAAIIVLLLIAWLYPMYNASKETAAPPESQIILADSVADETGESEQAGDPLQTPASESEMVLTMDDPNEPPYHMLGILSYKGAKVVTFELPDGEADEITNASLQIATDIKSKTNLEERTFRVDVLSGPYTLQENEVDDGKVMIGKIEFTKSKQGDGGLGLDETIRYSMEKNGQYILFALQLHSGNPAAYDPPVKEFDFDEQVAYLENILRTMKTP